MLLSLALIILVGLSLKGIFQKMHLPGLLGLLLAGVILGPYALDLIDPGTIGASGELRKIALIIILVRAGLSIDLKDLRKVGRPALLMCFVPAAFEIAGVFLLAPPLLGISRVEAAMLGAILGAVSPAITIPKMLHVAEEGFGRSRSVPQLIMAGASADNIFCIALFTAFLGLYSDGLFRPVTLVKMPVSVIAGLLTGIAAGLLLVFIFKKIHMRDTAKVLIILGVSLLMMGAEGLISRILPFSGLMAVIALSGSILEKYDVLAKRITGKFGKIWVAAELALFVLLGAAVDIRYAAAAGIAGIAAVVLLVICGLVFRSAGVWLSLIRSGISTREKIFCIISYLPKATVQAAIGALPLAAGVPAGATILTAAVIAVIITAPLGAIFIDISYRRLLAAPDMENHSVV